jgi:glycosyltransferase involved in cell wall biosynthesis
VKEFAKPVVAPSAASTAAPVPVMHFIHSIAYGGVETAVLNWLRTIDRRRYTPHLVCFSNPGQSERPFVEAAARAGFEVETIPWRRTKPVLQSARRLAALMHEGGVRILHTHNTYADLVGLVAARMGRTQGARVRTITTLYVWSKFNWKRDLLQWCNRMLLRWFDLVSAHCEITYDQTLAFGVCPERLRLLICGFEAPLYEGSREERDRRRRELGAQPGDPVLINVARLYPEKEQKMLLDYFSAIVAEEPHAKLWIAGVGPLEEELRTHCTELGLDDSVVFLGFIEDLPALLFLADIHVNTSSAEGVPLAICSAMAAALPIVATEVGGLPEILNHGGAGVLVPFGDKERFVEAVNAFIVSLSLRELYGAAARRFIAEDYSLTSAVKRLEQTYDELLHV